MTKKAERAGLLKRSSSEREPAILGNILGGVGGTMPGRRLTSGMVVGLDASTREGARRGDFWRGLRKGIASTDDDLLSSFTNTWARTPNVRGLRLKILIASLLGVGTVGAGMYAGARLGGAVQRAIVD